MDCRRSVRKSILAALPGLRAYAILLTGNRERADDLVQEALVRALDQIRSLQRWADAPSWLAGILRNQSMSDYRNSRCEVRYLDGKLVPSPIRQPTMAVNVQNALARLPIDQRDALILICGSGFSYEKAAGICRCPVGTVKSRVHRARRTLAIILAADKANRWVFGHVRPLIH